MEFGERLTSQMSHLGTADFKEEGWMQGADRVRKRGPRLEALPVAPATVAAQMFTAAGHPIWPYSDSETLAALTHLAELFDCKVVHEQSSPTSIENLGRHRRDAVVVSARDDADEVASLYAHLTNRRYLSAENYASGEVRRPDVVVAPSDVLTPTFLRQLYSQPAWAPGLISGGSPKALLRQALLRAAAVKLRSRTSRKRVDVQPLAEFARIAFGEYEILGRRAGRAQLRRALGSGSELLTVFTVGDGIDAGLGELILCPMDRMPAGSEGPTPSCIVSGVCHRSQVPLEEFAHSGRRLSPEAISARVLILHACWGIQPAGTLYSPVWGYGHRLADHPGLGAMLTTWEITVASPSDTDPLARDLERGRPLGRALARFNQSASSRKSGQLMCLLGDPDLRVNPAARAPVIRKPAPRGMSAQSKVGQLSFLAAYLSVIKPNRESKAPLAAARNAVAVCQRRGWLGLAIDTPDEPFGTAMRHAVLEFLCTHGTIPAYHWMDLGHTVSSKESGSGCFACDQLDREVTLSLRVPGAGSRKLQLCPRCGLTEDRPAAKERIGLTIAEGMACVQLSPPRDAWAAALLFRPNVGKPIPWKWPEGDDNKPSPAMHVPNEHTQGAGQFLLFMIEGADLTIARTPFAP